MGVKFDRLCYGGDYNPDQWLECPEILEEDIRLMKKAHVNTVSLGIFAWAKLEPEEGVYDFEWMEKIINHLYENGIYVFLATPSGARPHWLADRYPEVLRVNEMRQKNIFGQRHNHCYTSPIYRQKVRQINMKLAERFGDHPGVLMWHISNEYGGECHCPLCQSAFRGWLKKKYNNDIKEVNRKWNTAFWSHDYQNFDQIESPTPLGETSIHGLVLDWKRFVSWDNYPQWHKGPEHLVAMDNGMQHDIMRTLKKEPFILMESCPGPTNWQSVSKLKRPGMLETASLQAVAHGSDSVMYFQIRKGRGGFEKFHGALIDHYGKEDERTYQECKEVGADLEQIDELKHANVKADVAVIYDWENRWAVEEAQGPRNKGMFYKETVEKHYYAFRKLGLNVDLPDMTQDLDGYKIVVAPMLYMFRAGFEEKVRKFVENGGTFIMTYWSGVVDENDLCVLGGTPGGLMDVMGLRSTEIDALYDGETNVVKAVVGDVSYQCERFCQLVDVKTAEPLFVYGEDFYAGTPAMTVNEFGKGKAYYICADAEQKFFDNVYEEIVTKAGVERPLKQPVPEGIEVCTRQSKDAEYVFIQNFNKVSTAFKPELDGAEVLFGEVTGEMKPFSTIILKR